MWIKYFTGKQSIYAQKSQDISHRIILEEYTSFKSTYTSIFKEKFQKSVAYTSQFTDAPFNTTSQELPEEHIGNEKDLRLHL